MASRKRRSTSTAERSPLRDRVKEQRRSVYRQAINEAAERVFAAKGADRSHMREIAAEAGISLGTLYGVIDGKQSLLFGIHKARMREFLDCIRRARDAHDETLARHLAVVREGARYFLERPDFLRMCCNAGFGWASRIDTASRANEASEASEFWNEGSSLLRDLFARGIAEGLYVADEPELMVRKMLALKQAELGWWVERGMTAPHERVLDRLEDQFLRAFRAREV